MQEDAAWVPAGDRNKGAKAPVAWGADQCREVAWVDQCQPGPWAVQWRLVPLDSAFVLTVDNRCSIFQVSLVSNAHARRVAPLWQGNNQQTPERSGHHAKRR
jgi:hypothetical protein